MKVLVFLEQRDGKLKNSAFEAITLGRKLAGSSSDLAGVLVGSGVAELVKGVEGFGADTVFVGDQPEFSNYNVLNYAAVVEAAIKKFSPQVVVSPASPMGRDLFSRLAARFNAAIVSDAVAIELEGTELVATKPLYAGKALAEVVLKGAALQFVTIRPNLFGSNRSGDGRADLQKLEVALQTAIDQRTVEVRKGATSKVDLTEARVIVSGGRAVGSAQNFAVIEELAAVLGATVGASRAAVDSGYRPHSDQVGQTGKTVNPNLYIACGISGAIQHLAGMRTSKVIVAINSDPEAPIFSVCDYGIVGDLFEVVPALTHRLKAML